MRVGAGLALLLLLTACEQEPDFDARYEAAEKHIREQAQSIDAEIAEREALRRTTAGAADGEEATDGAPAAATPSSE